MVLAHDTVGCLGAAVALVNSSVAPDTLEDVEDLDAVFAAFGYTGRHDRSAEELAGVRAARPALRELLTSPRDRTAELVNAVLSDAGATPRLVRHDGADWHLHAVPDDSPLTTRILVETAMAMVDLIRDDETSRLGACAADDCDGVVLDLSRNRSRRFCSTRCGNREAVATYRARRASSAPA